MDRKEEMGHGRGQREQQILKMPQLFLVLKKKNLVFIKGVNKRLPRTMNSEENHLVYVTGRRQLVILTQ